ncbi:hypothetical protein [Salinisphaera hydrothermalis]|uniref:hypothetical protein n=1 Tax=Salinisphaera hydrothermalis TaxID=563188 RepID=UPI0033401B8D
MSRIRRVLGGAAAGVWLAALAGCAHEHASHGPGAAQFVSAEYGVAMVYPASLDAAHGFQSGYFLSSHWNPDAAQTVPGKGVLTLTLPRSNKLTTGEFRLGVSDDRRAVQHCALPSDGQAGATSTVVIDGVTFKRRDAEDAGMNHFMLRHAYRGVAHGHCYAIDLIVDGTNPGVYPGNPTPPMTNKAAFQRLTALLDGLTFSGNGT